MLKWAVSGKPGEFRRRFTVRQIRSGSIDGHHPKYLENTKFCENPDDSHTELEKS